MSIYNGHIVCGLPHILNGKNPGYEKLKESMVCIGDELEAAGVERIIYYSTQWISVLGHSFQAGSELKGLHVDENWHELPDLKFDLNVDTDIAEKFAKEASENHYQTKLINYQGFPVDTGTIVADSLINKNRFTVGMVSCCVYSDYQDTNKLARILRPVLENDAKKTAIVTISHLSGRFFTTDIDVREDQIRLAEDDVWNRKILSLLEKGQYVDFESKREEYAKACKVDMGFKVMAFLKGMDLLTSPAKLRSYEPVYGTGNAVVTFG